MATNDQYTQGLPAVFSQTAMDPAFQKSKVDPTDISKGIGQAFGVVSIRGKVFRIKHRGEEYPVVIPGTQNAAPTLDVIIVKASPVISKIFYIGQFVEGSRDAPDCWSTNGITPDAAAPKKQGQFCASCPQNAWGSKTVNGKAAKACQDNKRIAVVPFLDPMNEAFGGPMLMRVPPASLQDMSAYNQLLQQYNHSYFTVGTQLRFDIDTAHPKLLFSPIQPITGEIANLIVGLQDHPQVHRMLTEGVEFVKAEEQPQPPGPTPPFPGGQPAPVQQAAPMPAPVQAAPPPPPMPTPVQAEPDLTLPAHLVRTVTDAQAQPAVPAPPPPPSVEALQRELAEAKAKLEAAKPARAPRGGRKGATPPPSPAPATIENPPQQVGFSVTAPQPPQSGGVAFGAPQGVLPTGVVPGATPTSGQLPAGMDNMLNNLLAKKPN